MSSVDERIVDMEFKATSFLTSVSSVISALAKLKSSLNLTGAEESINDLDAAGKKFSLSGMASAAESVGSKFGALGVLGVSALATIASKAVSAGIDLVKGFTIDPILEGLDTYEQKINAIQTILANTQSEGTNLSQVTGALNNLNTYATKTVYNFGQMAQSIGTFTAAGVDLQTSVSSIKGIANLAALSGSSAEQASTAMYQLSQAIASGSVKLQDWNSVVNAGLGGKVFQNALEQTAKATGVNIDAIIKKAGSFRNSLQEGWLSTKILTQTLDTFTGDLSASQLKAMGYTNQQTAAILKQAAAAVQSATQVRTISQLQQDLTEEVGTAWGAIFQALIGNITQATALLSSVHNVLENAFTKPIYDLAALLQLWNQLGGRADVIQGLSNLFKAFSVVIDAVKEAFTDVFPPATAQDLVALSKDFEDLTAALIPSKEQAGLIRDIFIGLFSAVKIVLDVIGGIAKGFSGVGSAAESGVGGVTAIAAHIADFINEALQFVEGNANFTNALKDIGEVLSAPIKLLGLAAGAVTDLGSAVEAAWKFIEPFADEVGAEFSKLGSAIADAINGGGISNIENILNQGIFALILLQVKKFIANLGKGEDEEKPGFLDTIKESFESLTTTLHSMQQTLKATILLEIAAAVGVLTASVIALSFINAAKLTQALTAITFMFTELLAGMAVISKVAGSEGILKMPIIAFSLNLLATAILILSAAVVILAAFSWEGLGKGIATIAVLLAELVVAVRTMGTDSANLIASAYSMEVMATALNILAIAVRTLGKLDIGTLAKGVGTIAALLLVLAAFQKIGGGENLITTAASMVIVGAALNIIAAAIGKLGAMSWESLAKGMVSVATALAVISADMILMEGSLPGAVAILVVSAALVVLAQAMTTFGGMSWDQIAKSLVELAASLIIISAAMVLMEAALPGAAALLVVAASLAILAPVLIALGSLSWSQLLISLAGLAGTLLILGGASLVLAPLIPVMLGLGLAIALFGVGILAAGAGVLAFALGLTALAAAVTASGLAITAFVSAIIGLIPLAITQFGVGLIDLAGVIGNGGPAITKAFQALLLALLNAVIAVTPKIVQAVEVILTQLIALIGKETTPAINAMTTLTLKLLAAITSRAGQFTTAGANALIAVINGISKQIGRIATAGGNAAISFINAIGAQAGRIDAAGVNMVINLVNGLANTIRSDSGRMHAAGENLASAIIEGMISGMSGGIGGVEAEAKAVAESALNAAKNFLGIHSPSKRFEQEVGEESGSGIAVGFINMVGTITDAATTVSKKALGAFQENLSNVSDIVNENLDIQPTITPVIDLTQAQSGLSALNNLTKNQLLSANVSTNKATSISAENAATAEEAGLITPTGSNLTFNQYNNSPKSLSTADIYRQTKNQLSVVKEALPK